MTLPRFLALSTVAFVSLSALAFEAGRRVATASPIKRDHARKVEMLRLEPSATLLRDEDILTGDIATLPFEKLHDALRSATPEICAEWIRELAKIQNPARQRAATSSFFKAFVQVDPAAATKAVLGIENSGVKWLAMHACFQAAPQSAMADVVKMLFQLPEEFVTPGHSRDLFGEAIGKWAQVDPPAVAEFIEENQTERVQLYASQLINRWAAIDPEAAKDWMRRNASNKQMDSLLQDYLNGWFQFDHAAATEFVLAHSDDPEIADTAAAFAPWLYEDSPDEARDYMNRLASDETREKALNNFVWLADAMDPPRADKQTTSPEAVAKWLISFPDELSRHAMSSLLEQWIRGDPVGMSAWMIQLPREKRGTLIENFSSFEIDDDTGLASIMKIPDSGLQQELLRHVISQQLSPDAIEADTELSIDQKQYLVQLEQQLKSGR